MGKCIGFLMYLLLICESTFQGTCRKFWCLVINSENSSYSICPFSALVNGPWGEMYQNVRSFPVRQMVGKLSKSQTSPSTQPFSRVITDSVVLMAQTKSGNSYPSVDKHVWFCTVSRWNVFAEDHIPCHYQCFSQNFPLVLHSQWNSISKGFTFHLWDISLIIASARP